jgi:hypothetical protein
LTDLNSAIFILFYGIIVIDSEYNNFKTL